MIDEEALFQARGPWVHQVAQWEPSPRWQGLVDEAGALVVTLDGTRMRTVDGLFSEYAREFSFPAYFGRNWPAFAECMTELSECPARSYLTVVSNGGQVLSEERDDCDTLLRQLGKIGQYWSRTFALGPAWGDGEVPFHTVLVGH